MFMTTPNPCVALLRHQLFLPSEPFIAEQARALRKFVPLLVGRVLGGKPSGDLGFHVPAAGRLRQLSYVLRRDPRLFLPELARAKPVLIHAHFGVEAVYGMELAERLGVPLVTTFHGFDATMKSADLIASRKPSWINYLLKRAELKRRGDLFICVSESIRAKLLELGFPAARTRLHYIGVDTTRFEPDTTERKAPIVLHVARLVEKKGTAYLLEAFARIAPKHPGAELVVIGAGPLSEPLAARAAELGLEGRVRWLGALPHAEVRQWLKRAAVFCLPSCTAASGDAEGLPISVLEAAASGTPVVATRHGGIPEAVEDGTSGYLVAERDSGALGEALDALLSSQVLRDSMARGARKVAETRFDLQRQTGELERLYEAVL
jgi:glycosyltransferase involved in cell wall biosynthesis